MSTVTLSDGTKVPQHYDFNQHFEPLTVKNQGQQGICWWETRCTMLEALWRCYTDKAPTFDPHMLGHNDEGWAVSHWQDLRFDPPRELGTMTYIGGDELTNLDGYKDLPPAEAVAKALWTNGVVEGGVKCQQSMERVWQKPWRYEGWNANKDRFTHIPTLHVLPGDLEAVAKNNWAHAVIYVGYRLLLDGAKVQGIETLLQNSWSGRFGKAGRVYLGGDMAAQGCADAGFIHSFNDHPANGLKMPPLRAA